MSKNEKSADADALPAGEAPSDLKEKKEAEAEPMFTLKFSSPILPYASFPLT